MRALIFGVEPEPWEAPAGANPLVENLARTPMRLMEVEDAKPLRPDWVVVRPRMTGICGSDSKQALLDFGESEGDNAMGGLCSFPQVMGHEVVGDVVALGPQASGVDVGQRGVGVSEPRAGPPFQLHVHVRRYIPVSVHDSPQHGRHGHRAVAG